MGRRNLKNDKENNDQEKRTKILTMIYNATSAGGLLVPEGIIGTGMVYYFSLGHCFLCHSSNYAFPLPLLFMKKSLKIPKG
jgi:hypothetical protein